MAGHCPPLSMRSLMAGHCPPLSMALLTMRRPTVQAERLFDELRARAARPDWLRSIRRNLSVARSLFEYAHAARGAREPDPTNMSSLRLGGAVRAIVDELLFQSASSLE